MNSFQKKTKKPIVRPTNDDLPIKIAQNKDDILDTEDNILSIDGYTDNKCLQIDISGMNQSSNMKSIIKEQLPWIEKYRPKLLVDAILSNNIASKIERIISEKNMPNLIITGVPGIGKTTTIKCIARALYGKYVNTAVLELNASGDRGMKIVEDTITNFCKKAVNMADTPTTKYAKHKLIILDEADNITSKAQFLINKKMQEYGDTTRFAFTCNKSSDIIEAIQSRCIILRYFRLPQNKILEKLNNICISENIKYEEKALHEISILAQGDLRASINILQMVNNGLFDITLENIYKIYDKPPVAHLYNILKLCIETNISDAFKLIKKLKEKGYSETDIILGLINVIKMMSPNDYDEDKLFSEHDKIRLMKIICKYAYNISNGIISELQIFSCISDIIVEYSH